MTYIRKKFFSPTKESPANRSNGNIDKIEMAGYV